MSQPNIELLVETQPDSQDVAFLEDRINEFNITRTGFDDGQSLAIFVRDDRAEIVAGLSGFTWGGCCEIRFLWVHERLRGQGYGSQLLAAAEREAIARGCQVIALGTHSFQAPDFYQKLGYEIVGTLEGYPRKYKQYLLRKELSPARNSQS